MTPPSDPRAQDEARAREVLAQAREIAIKFALPGRLGISSYATREGRADDMDFMRALVTALTEARVPAGMVMAEPLRGSPPEPVSHPNEAWCEAYADWYYQGRG